MKDIKNLYIAFLAYLTPFIFSGVYYADDLFRARLGFNGWTFDGRPLSELSYKILTLFQSDSVPDVYPLPLLISGFLFCAIIGKFIKHSGVNDSWLNFSLLLALLANPYFISNLMFRYDGYFMLISVAVCLIPFCFNAEKIVSWFIITTICLVSCLSLYQASINVFIGTVGAYLTINAIRKKSFTYNIKFIVFSFFCVCASYLIYSNIITVIFPTSDYTREYSGILSLNKDGFNIFISNIKKSFELVLISMKSGLFIPTIIVYFIAFCLTIIYSYKNKKTYVYAYFIISILIVTFSISGIIVFGQHAKFYPRVFLGFSVFLLFPLLILFILTSSKSLRLISSMIILIPVLNISTASINTIKQNNEYTKLVANRIVSDINNSTARNNKEFAVIGTLQNSDRAKLNISIYPIIGLLNHAIFSDGYAAGRFVLMNLGIQDITYISYDDSLKLFNGSENVEYISNNELYSIKNVNNITLLVFK